MWSLQRPVIVSHTLLAVAIILLALTSDTPSAQAIAGGAPYADPAYCSALPALVTKFESTVLPQQARDLADQKWRLSEAEAGRAEAAEEFNKALRARGLCRRLAPKPDRPGHLHEVRRG